jgi:hypothetical protein
MYFSDGLTLIFHEAAMLNYPTNSAIGLGLFGAKY